MIGIFGGTFDPVHFGHIRPALDLLQGVGLQEVRMIPCYQPPHRETPVASPQQRLAMLEAAVEEYTGLRVDPREMERGGISYMVDTLTSLRQELPEVPLCLLLGSDAFAGLAGWHRWRELLELAHIVIAQRPGTTLALSGELARQHDARRVTDVRQLRQRMAGSVLHFEVTQLDISATRIRALLAAGESVEGMLPEVVLKMIRQQGLYGASVK